MITKIIANDKPTIHVKKMSFLQQIKTVTNSFSKFYQANLFNCQYLVTDERRVSVNSVLYCGTIITGENTAAPNPQCL